jgi:hypothetical protein
VADAVENVGVHLLLDFNRAVGGEKLEQNLDFSVLVPRVLKDSLAG